MPSAFYNTSVGSGINGTQIFNASDDGGGCAAFMITCPSGSVSDVLINIQGLHKAGEWFPVSVGKEAVFRLYSNGIASIYARGNGGTATIGGGIIARI